MTGGVCEVFGWVGMVLLLLGCLGFLGDDDDGYSYGCLA